MTTQQPSCNKKLVIRQDENVSLQIAGKRITQYYRNATKLLRKGQGKNRSHVFLGFSVHFLEVSGQENLQSI